MSKLDQRKRREEEGPVLTFCKIRNSRKKTRRTAIRHGQLCFKERGATGASTWLLRKGLRKGRVSFRRGKWSRDRTLKRWGGIAVAIRRMETRYEEEKNKRVWSRLTDDQENLLKELRSISVCTWNGGETMAESSDEPRIK